MNVIYYLTKKDILFFLRIYSYSVSNKNKTKLTFIRNIFLIDNIT